MRKQAITWRKRVGRRLNPVRKAAQSNLAANEALIKGSNENSTPDVLVAQAKLKQALLDLERTEIKAPFDGVVTSRKIQVGQHVAPGFGAHGGGANFTVICRREL